MTDSRFITQLNEIKSEPYDPEFEKESSSCIEYKNINDVEMKCEVEEEKIQESNSYENNEQSRAFLKEPSVNEYNQPSSAESTKSFVQNFKEFLKLYEFQMENHKEEIIARIFLGKNVTEIEMKGPSEKLFDILSSNFRSIDEPKESDLFSSTSKTILLLIPNEYPQVFFSDSHLKTLKEFLKSMSDNDNVSSSKIFLEKGLIKIKCIDMSTFNFFIKKGLLKGVEDTKTFIDDHNHVWKTYKCDPRSSPFSNINNNPQKPLLIPNEPSKPIKTMIRVSLKDLKKLTETKDDKNSNLKNSETTKQLSTNSKGQSTDIKIKDEPVENVETIISEVKIKQENIEDLPMISNLPEHLAEDQPCSSQEETFIITEVKQELTEEDFSYFTSNYPMTPENSEEMAQDDDDDDEFQYNTVNSFKSDLATRRSVSHTVVSGKSNKSKAEAALLAMQELMKIEQEKKMERERSAAGLNQVEKPKTMNVSLNVNGIRVVTKVPLPNVEQKTQKPLKSVEEECKFQCPVCFIKFKNQGQLIGHKRIHDTAKAKLNTADMTKNVYKEVKMKIEPIGNRRSIHVLLPNYDYAFIVTNSTANKLYMKCFRQTCDVKAYSTNDGKFFIKEGEQHLHGSDKVAILSRINEKKLNDLEKTDVINKQVHEAILQKQKQKNLLEEKKSALIERIKRSQEAASGKKPIREVKRRRID